MAVKKEYILYLIILASIIFNLYNWFKPEPPIDKSEEKRLEAENKRLEAKNDSLRGEITKIDQQLKMLEGKADSLEVVITDNKQKIQNLNTRRNESIKVIDSLDDSELDSFFANFSTEEEDN